MSPISGADAARSEGRRSLCLKQDKFVKVQERVLVSAQSPVPIISESLYVSAYLNRRRAHLAMQTPPVLFPQGRLFAAKLLLDTEFVNCRPQFHRLGHTIMKKCSHLSGEGRSRDRARAQRRTARNWSAKLQQLFPS